MESFNPVDMFKHMSWLDKGVVILLLVMSVYSLWVMIDRFAVFSKAKRYSLAFVLALRDRMAKRDLNGALKLSKAEPQSPIAKVIFEALTEYRDGLDAIAKTGPDEIGDFDVVDAVNRAIDRVKEREIANMKKGLGGLASISSAAPFIGLFGTVIGIINAFRRWRRRARAASARCRRASPKRSSRPPPASLVAIPAVMVFNYFTNTIEQFVVDMNDVSSELISYVLREGREREKHGGRHGFDSARPCAAAGDEAGEDPQAARRPRSSRATRRTEINVTPLVDVVLVLLIIFMVVTPMLHRGVHVQLPETKNHEKKQDTGEQLVVTIRGDGAVFIETDRIADDQLVDAREAGAEEARGRCTCAATSAVRYGVVRKVLEKIHDAGAQNVGMGTEEMK